MEPTTFIWRGGDGQSLNLYVDLPKGDLPVRRRKYITFEWNTKTKRAEFRTSDREQIRAVLQHREYCLFHHIYAEGQIEPNHPTVGGPRVTMVRGGPAAPETLHLFHIAPRPANAN